MTEIQKRFAVEYATNGGDVTKAAIDAGYSEKSAVDLGRRALANPNVQEIVIRELTRLRSRSGAIGWSALIRIAQNEAAPAAAVVAAGRALMEHAGMLGTGKELDDARRKADDPNAGKVIDYVRILNALAKIPGRANDDDSLRRQTA